MSGESIQSPNPFQKRWLILLLLVAYSTSWALDTSFLACGTAFPRIPAWLWISHVVFHLANRIPIFGWTWRHGWKENLERLLFMCTLSFFVIAMTVRTTFDRPFWIGSSIAAFIWVVYHMVSSINSAKEYPMKNRIFGASIGLFTDSPLLFGCLSALKHSV
jgi:uncharacterized membrane protein